MPTPEPINQAELERLMRLAEPYSPCRYNELAEYLADHAVEILALLRRGTAPRAHTATEELVTLGMMALYGEGGPPSFDYRSKVEVHDKEWVKNAFRAAINAAAPHP